LNIRSVLDNDVFTQTGGREAAVIGHLHKVLEIVELGQRCHRSFDGTMSQRKGIYRYQASTRIFLHVTASSEASIRRKMMKKILGAYGAPPQHWVGDGFPVRSLFSYSSHDQYMSPFLLLDHAGPASFTPTDDRRGVGVHPHRGFETVTIVYRGEVEHRDSTGAGGTIGPGDVQWMTAGAGILHEEYHAPAFARSGGTLDMVQLWVNLPARDKMTAPRYQTLLRQDIPVVELPGGAGSLRVIAGKYGDSAGPAHTFSPMDVWDLHLQRSSSTTLVFKAGRTAALVILRGTVRVNGSDIAREDRLVLLDRDAGDVLLEADNEATLLVLSGEPLNEPIVGHGPFVMNTRREIDQALADFKSGKFGRIQ
jgi:redox-sensitive bicupin YhaK (pirin superfamily)